MFVCVFVEGFGMSGLSHSHTKSQCIDARKRVIIIVVSAIVFQEAMERNTVVGSAIAISGTFAYSMASKKPAAAAPKKKAE